ncbi:Oidioi.mRNA.OKI2018_I69.chr2.g6631.t1.cds [Oikopleura dioica]|uniref:Oidioi.mRNA.OKI2018_I69.chr2.g6631.t1.cds n=1 Tax=Oikopleura dioica TaxID=34765 RepID=A0ABN7TAN3_OIKDI|nr:Oidioi.mRNA.OKI2018_I69.chr2.g6631.t1.cds [Oikopleura dioica]
MNSAQRENQHAIEKLRIDITSGPSYFSAKDVFIEVAFKTGPSERWLLRAVSRQTDIFEVTLCRPRTSKISYIKLQVDFEALASPKWICQRLRLDALREGELDWRSVLEFNGEIIFSKTESRVLRPQSSFPHQNVADFSSGLNSLLSGCLPVGILEGNLKQEKTRMNRNFDSPKRKIKYWIRIKTCGQLSTEGFNGILMTLIGTKDWSNPIAINGKLTGELQYLCVDLEPIGKVQKVLFDNVTRSIPIDWVQIIPDSSSPILLTNIQQSGNRMLALKGFQYKVFLMTGQKLRKDAVKLSIKLIGSRTSSQVHELNTKALRVGSEIETDFYDKNLGLIEKVVLYLDEGNAGADLYLEKINIQKSRNEVLDQSELRIQFDKRILFEINDWIKFKPEGQEYQHRVELCTSDRESFLKLSTSWDDIAKTLPGSSSARVGFITRSRSGGNISLSPESTVNLALRTQNTVMARLQVPALTGNRIDTIHFKDKEMIPNVDQVSLDLSHLAPSDTWYCEHILLKKLSCRGTIMFPVCKQLSRNVKPLTLTPGVKYRVYVYSPARSEIGRRSFLRLRGSDGKTSKILHLSSEAEKRFKQETDDFEVTCFDFGGKDIGSIIGGVLWTEDCVRWYCHQIQVQLCRMAADSKVNWTLAKIFPVEKWISKQSPEPVTFE